ncbi:hypothetical protein [Desulforudis sp. 1031]|uniref:hypothetical protein n=1 Tax=Desulforudis sp. 1031 TaxID=3416138 RepID=UPI003CFAE4D8
MGATSRPGGGVTGSFGLGRGVVPDPGHATVAMRGIFAPHREQTHTVTVSAEYQT